MDKMFSKLQATSSLSEWLFYLEQQTSQPIEHVFLQQIAEQQNLLHPAKYIITVTGTNGKGSTCHLLANYLTKAGYQVGLFTSPHLIHYHERITIQQQTLAELDYTWALAQVQQYFPANLGYFKHCFLSALYLFQRQVLDFVILEVGIGGLQDITNIIDADLAIITNIDIDHGTVLGNTRAEIGLQKAGIFRHNKPAIIGDTNIPASVINYAEQIRTRLVRNNYEWFYKIEHIEQSNLKTNFIQLTWFMANKTMQITNPYLPAHSIACVLTALALMPVTWDKALIVDTMVNTRLAGRFQQLNQSVIQTVAKQIGLDAKGLAKIILDVGHNPNAAQYLADKLIQLKQPHSKVYAICGMLNDKDSSQVFRLLDGSIDHWNFISINTMRGRTATEMAMLYQTSIKAFNYSCFKSLQDAVKNNLQQLSKHDYLLIFGSFATVSMFLQLSSQ